MTEIHHIESASLTHCMHLILLMKLFLFALIAIYVQSISKSDVNPKSIPVESLTRLASAQWYPYQLKSQNSLNLTYRWRRVKLASQGESLWQPGIKFIEQIK